MRQFTDPVITDDDPPGTGEVNVNKSLHVQELRDEVAKLSLFVPMLDERPLVHKMGERQTASAGDNTLLDIDGSGVLRTLWIANHITANKGSGEGGRVKIYVDDEVNPRVDCSWREFTFSIDSQPFYADLHGISTPSTAYTYAALSGYRYLNLPFHTALKVVFDSEGAGTYYFWQAAYNYSSTVDFDYGRYNYLNLSTTNGTIAGPEDDGEGYPTNYQKATFLNVTNRGALVAIYKHLSFTDMSALEGNFNAFIDGETTASIKTSGFEDIFLGGYYWYGFTENGGTDAIPAATRPLLMSKHVGLTHLYLDTAPYSVGAYRYFDQSPICFDTSIECEYWNSEYNYWPGQVTLRTVCLYYTED